MLSRLRRKVNILIMRFNRLVTHVCMICLRSMCLTGRIPTSINKRVSISCLRNDQVSLMQGITLLTLSRKGKDLHFLEKQKAKTTRPVYEIVLLTTLLTA